MAGSFESRLGALKEAAEAGLEVALGRLDGPDGAAPGELVEAMRYAVLGGGKRLRPVLALAACEAICGDAERALGVACALELIHAYALVHDDLPCLDDDAERRGQPTVHVRFGEARAVLAGDALLTEAFRVLSRPVQGLDAAAQLRLVLLVSEAAGVAGMVGGQDHDMAAADGLRTAESLEAMHAMKTGALFRAAVVGGGIAGGADEGQQAALDRYGRALGRAFQLTDDLLDLEESGRQGSTGDVHEDAVNLAVRLGPEVCRAQAQALVEVAIKAVGVFGEGGEVLSGVAALVARRRV